MQFWPKAGLATLMCGAALAGDAVAQPPPADTISPASAAISAPPLSVSQPMAGGDIEWLRQGVTAAKAGDLGRARQAIGALSNPVARSIVEWAIIDSMPDRVPFAELDQARLVLWGWPRRATRQIAAERQLEASGLGPQQIIDWFQNAEPQSAEGAMALAAAYQAAGRPGDAQALIRRFWREKVFEADTQRLMLTRFGAYLTMDDHVRRADTLLFGQQGPAARDMVALLPPDQQALANARLALRNNASNASELYAQVPPELAHDPGLAVERARWLISKGQGLQALPLLADFPAQPGEDAAVRIWGVRRQLVNVALQSGDVSSAYMAVDKPGLDSGAEAADAEFLAGWIALDRLHDPALAAQRFQNLEKIGSSPITQGRALYWLGRAREAQGDQGGARDAYLRGAQFNTTFYGQLAGARAGQTELVLDRDPQPTPEDRARFEGREIVQAIRMLGSIGMGNVADTLTVAAADTLPDAGECAMLVDLARGNGEQDLSMRVVRLCAQRGFVLTERGYPVRAPPPSDSVEAAMVLGIIRQESGFDPRVRSGVGARGMMQLMPATAKVVARRSGVPYSVNRLDEAEYNMELGTRFLGDLVNEFSGSYVMAAAAYNAGPGRPTQWLGPCGDPRTSSSDPVDYIECIPISETRNYVMRVMEGMQVYRARLNGGRAPLTLASDLKRGGYGSNVQVASAGATIDTLLQGSGGADAPSDPGDIVASTPVPNPPETRRAAPEPEVRESRQVRGHVSKVRVSSRTAARHSSKGSAKTATHSAKKKKRT